MTLQTKIATVHDKLAKKSTTEEFNYCYQKAMRIIQSQKQTE